MASVMGSDIMGIILYLYKEPHFIKFLNYRIPCGISVHPGIFSAVLIDSAVIIHYVYNIKIMSLADLKVIRIVCRSYLHDTGSEFHIDIIVCDNRHLTVHYRKHYLLSDKPRISLIIRIYRYRRISKHGLRPGSCKGKIIIRPYDLILYMPEMAVLILILHLGIRYRSTADRAPVYHFVPFIYQSFFI